MSLAAEFTVYLMQVTSEAGTGNRPRGQGAEDGMEEGFEQPEIRVGEDTSVFTRLADLHNPKWVAAILDAITIGPDLTSEQRSVMEDFITEFADCYTLSMKETQNLTRKYINGPPPLHRSNGTMG
ncbi:hypothetical protein C8R43DRAFT_1152969 [Mycena crocata]|nr:hypothetical protein C8R43DRAFT_1152969 [Mycena crocata]